jgi:micrococcal nuclease
MDWRHEAVITRVVDADTVDAECRLPFKIKFTDRFRLAMSNGTSIDAPEVRGSERLEGLKATQHLIELLNTHCDTADLLDGGPGWKCIIQTFKDKRGKYGRWIASIEGTDGHQIVDQLVTDGHADIVVY